MYSKKKLVKSIILVLAILAILIVLLMSLGDIKNIVNILTTKTNYWFILLCLLISFLNCVFAQLSFVVLVKTSDKNVSFLNAFRIAGAEFFFNAVTPFSTGGQPFQAYALKRVGMKYSDSTPALLMNFLTYQISINIYSIIALILYFNKITSEVNNVSWFIIIGFTINFAMMVFLIMIGTTKFMGKFMMKLIDLLTKIRFLKKHLEKKKDDFAIYISDMQNTFKSMTKCYKQWILSFLFKMLGLFFYYSIPFFVFYAFDIKLGLQDLFYVVSMTSFALTICIWLPTPGASGGAELAFTTLFAGMLAKYVDNNSDIAVSGMLLWRLLTYYLMMIYGFILYIRYERGNRDEDRVIY